MKIQDCKFTKENILVAVLPDGTVCLGNAETKQFYQVNVVKKPAVKNISGSKPFKYKILYPSRCSGKGGF